MIKVHFNKFGLAEINDGVWKAIDAPYMTGVLNAEQETQDEFETIGGDPGPKDFSKSVLMLEVFPGKIITTPKAPDSPVEIDGIPVQY